LWRSARTGFQCDNQRTVGRETYLALEDLMLVFCKINDADHPRYR
jgi:hypothetical protein